MCLPVYGFELPLAVCLAARGNVSPAWYWPQVQRCACCSGRAIPAASVWAVRCLGSPVTHFWLALLFLIWRWWCLGSGGFPEPAPLAPPWWGTPHAPRWAVLCPLRQDGRGDTLILFIYRLTILNVYNSVALGTLAVLCSQHHYLVPELFPLQGNPFPIEQSLPPIPSSSPATRPLSVSMGLPVLDILYKWNHITCGLLCLASFH